jgi:hypothetical protein
MGRWPPSISGFGNRRCHNLFEIGPSAQRNRSAHGRETLSVARRIADDPQVRAVLICGNGPALTVGGDIDYSS